VKKSLLILVQNGMLAPPQQLPFLLDGVGCLMLTVGDGGGEGIVSAPLWNSKTSAFAGLLTSTDFINVVQYYWQNPDKLSQIDGFRLDSLRGMHLRSPPSPI